MIVPNLCWARVYTFIEKLFQNFCEKRRSSYTTSVGSTRVVVTSQGCMSGHDFVMPLCGQTRNGFARSCSKNVLRYAATAAE